MDPKSTSEQVFNDPYLLAKIVGKLDIRTLLKCSTVSKDFHGAIDYETQKRKDIVHLFLSETPKIRGVYRFRPPVPLLTVGLSRAFLHYTKHLLNVLIFVGGYLSIDYRRHSLRRVCEHLPKHCAITYIDGGIYSLVNDIRFKTVKVVTGGHESVQRLHFPCMACLLFPDMDGIDIGIYTDFEQISTDGVKCMLYFEEFRITGQQRHNANTQDFGPQFNELIRKFGHCVAFGGGCHMAVKVMDTSTPSEEVLRPHLILTFGGRRVRASSVVLSAQNESKYVSQLIAFKSGLDFDCDDTKQSRSIAFLFANSAINLSDSKLALRSVFPFVAAFGFVSNQQMYGHCYSPLNGCVYLSPIFVPRVHTNVKSVLVIINFSLKPDI